MTGVVFRRFGVEMALDPAQTGKVALVQSVGGVDCIPGPTVKGAFRAAVERYFAGLAQQGARKLTPCVPVPSNVQSPEEAEGVRQARRRDACVVTAGEERIELPSWIDVRGVCPACTLFGAQGLVGFIRCGFLRAKGGLLVGEMRVLWEDEARGWRFGTPRTIKGTELDLLSSDDPARLLNALLEQMRAVRRIGAAPKDGGADGSVQVQEIKITEQTG